MMRKLLENGADPNTPGPTCLLSEAISDNQCELAPVLLDNIADPNGQRYCPEPLQWAVERGSVDMARHLLTLGADANRCFEGKMPLLIGARHGNLELVKLLVDTGGAKITGMDGTRAPINAVEADSIDAARFFFERGVCPNLPRGSEEKSAVMKAVELRPVNLDMLNLLVSNGADVGQGHGGGRLQLASAKGSLSTVQIFLGAGADVNCLGIGNSSRTALEEAVRAENMGMVRLLLHASADIDAPPSQKWGMTALQQAIDANSLGMVRFLLAWRVCQRPLQPTRRSDSLATGCDPRQSPNCLNALETGSRRQRSRGSCWRAYRTRSGCRAWTPRSRLPSAS